MNSISNDSGQKRTMKEAQLEGRIDQKRALEFELQELKQTHQDPSAAVEKLAAVVAEISRLEQELQELARNPGHA